jgi:hypothetical protein
MEVMGVNSSVVLIPLFGIDVPASSKGIWFSSKFSRTEMYEEVELVEELRPTSLMAREELCGSKVLKVLMVCDNVNRLGRALKVVLPGPESFIDSEKFLIVGIVIEFRSGQHPGVECNRTKL